MAVPKRRSRKRPGQTCLICGQQVPVMTSKHLQQHGFTIAQYVRAYDPGAARPLGSHALQTLARDPGAVERSAEAAMRAGQLSRRIADELTSSPDFTARLADEVAQQIFDGPARQACRSALASVLAARLQAHGEAAAQLAAVRHELAQPWRVQQGGPAGAPTPTPVLVQQHGAALAELRSTEELVVRAVKLAVDEAKSRRDEPAGPAPLDGSRYSGSAERLPFQDAPPHEREAVRTLLGLLGQQARLERAIQARQVEARVLAVEPAGPGTSPAPPPAPSGDPARPDGTPASPPGEPAPRDTAQDL